MESIPTDNARLTAAIRDGSREAFDEMCGRYYAPLMAYARLFLKGNWAQDIVQDVFVNVWIRRETLDPRQSLYGYLLRSDVLKCGHHGSSTSTSDEFLEAVDPLYAVISCETGNRYGHPHRETIEKLEDRDITAYRTDKDGTILAESTGGSISFTTGLESVKGKDD